MTKIDSAGASVCHRTDDVLAAERWPVACVIMWIRAVRRGWSMPEVRDHLRRALRVGGAAFRVHDFPLEEVKALIDVAGASDAKLELFHDGGTVEAWQLGPDRGCFRRKTHPAGTRSAFFPTPRSTFRQDCSGYGAIGNKFNLRGPTRRLPLS
jgi:hypothetical protein